LGTLAAFIGTNTSASTLSNILGVSVNK
jgi:hypothetical protein